MQKLNKIINYSTKLVVCALLLVIVNAVINSPKASAVINAESSPTSDYNREKAERPSYSCGDGTYTRFQKTFNTGAGDYTYYYDSGIGAYRGRAKSLTIDVKSGYYVCPGTTYRNGSNQHLRIATAVGQHSAATMAGISGVDAGTISHGRVNSGYDSGWASHGIFTLNLQQGWNTLSFNFQTDTYVVLSNGSKSYIAGISPKVVYIYVDMSPYGNNDSVNCNNAQGWAFDPDNTSASISVHMYIDGGYVGQAVANQSRNDVNTAYGISGNHGYTVPIPASFMNGQTHTVAVYAIDIGGTHSGNPYIGGGTFNCTEIQGRVYDHTTGVGYAGVQIGLCNSGLGNNGNISTDSTGNFTFRATQFAGFCLVITGGAPSNIITGPRVRPWVNQYANQCTASFSTSKTSPLVGGYNYCPQGDYHWQVAGGNCHNNPANCGAGKVGGNDAVNDYDRNGDRGFDFIYITDIQLRGVKIDDSKVSTTGSTAGGWGGNCFSSSNPSYCNNGTLANYPFSDDCVQIDGGTCQTPNSFSFSGITPGNHNVSISLDGIDNGTIWDVRGYSICEEGAACTTQWLTDTDNISGASSFTHNFSGGKTYHMRWIFGTPPVINSVSASCSTVKATATVAGGGTYAIRLIVNDADVPDSNVPSGLQSGRTSGSETTFDVSSWADANPHTFTVRVRSTNNGIAKTFAPPINVPACVSPYTYPYFRTYNGDLMAGSGFAPDCTINDEAGILAFNKGDATGAGAGTQLAAFAYSKIYGFSSADMRSGTSAPIPPKGLSFANATGIGDDTYGGSFGYAPCMMNYAAESISSAYTVDTSLPATPIADSTKHVVKKSSGDLVISSNIEYQNSATWTNINQIPSLYVIVVGHDIYINSNVTRLDGVFIAQPVSGVGGRIYTCAVGGVAPTSAQIADPAICGANQLTVNGAFIAKTIKFLRTKGNYLTNSSENEASNSATLAEIFNYTPEMFLVPSPFTRSAPYQSITNSPPVL